MRYKSQKQSPPASPPEGFIKPLFQLRLNELNCTPNLYYFWDNSKKLFNMSNPLKIFQILLEKGNALDPSNIVETNDERLSIYDGDITGIIKMEAGIALINIDNTYWKNIKAENDYYVQRLLNNTDKLIIIANKSLEKYIESVVMRTDIDNWVIVYNNMRVILENLIKIRDTIIGSYSVDIPETYMRERTLIKYPFLNEHLAIELQKECKANIGIKNTLFGLINPKIEVKTEAMSMLLKDLQTEGIPMNHTENIKTIEKLSGKSPVETPSESPLEKMEYEGTVESLGLLYSLLFEVNLIKSENSKSKIGRILAKTVKIAGKNSEFTERSIIDMFNPKNRQYDKKNIPFIKEKLFNMLQILQKLDKKT